MHHRVKISIIRSLSQGIPFVNGPLAQLVEQLTLNQRVEGSTPSRLTITTPRAVSSKQPDGKRCEQHTALFVRAGMAATSETFFLSWRFPNPDKPELKAETKGISRKAAKDAK